MAFAQLSGARAMCGSAPGDLYATCGSLPALSIANGIRHAVNRRHCAAGQALGEKAMADKKVQAPCG
jgi:hypothetical protein